MSKAVNLTYVGDIRSLVASDKQIAFVTEHVESRPTSIYFLDGESNKLTSASLPRGGLSLCAHGDQFWVGGTDGKLYSLTAKDKSATASKAKLPVPASLIVSIDESLIACLTGEVVSILDQKGKAQQTFEFSVDDETVTPTAIGASPDGIWLAIGTNDGSVFVYEREDKTEFQLSESAQLHKAEVSAILFDREELRFFSAGMDQKLLVTHARGALEPEDRGRANNHTARISAMLHASEDRLITGSDDKTCKSWLSSGATKPSTLSDGIVAVSHLALATIHKRPVLIAAQSDNSIRTFLIEEGKFGSSQTRYNDGYFRAKQLFESNSPSDRGEAIHELAANDDRKSLEMLADRVANDPDNKLRLTAVKLICKSDHDCHHELLTGLLGHADEPIRQTVFDYLSKSKTDGRELLKLCDAAIKTGKPDIGCDAVKLTEKLTKDDSQSDAFRNRARDLLVQTLNSETVEIRRASVIALENVFEKGSATPNLIAIKSNNADSRRVGLIRLLQRKLLGNEESAGGIRQMIEDPDAEVRKTARLLLYLSRKNLAEALRARDKDLDRQFDDLISFSLDVGTKKKSKKEIGKDEPAKKSKQAPKKAAKLNLKDDDYQPLLHAAAAQAMDTSLSGAKCLALLEDSRAFGVLMQLSNESDNNARVDVCKALGALGDPRANDRLSALLRDPEIEVRDAAYSALEKTSSKDPLANAGVGLAVEAEDIRRRGLQTLVKKIRKSPPKDTDSTECVLLKRALNDASQSVRGEAFKVVLNSKIGGGVEQSLRFALNSAHAEVRREVLTEVMAQQKEKWAPGLLLDMLNDPAAEIRTDAFAHLKKEKKETDIEWLETSIKSEYPDVRKLAVKLLIKNRTDESTQLLLHAIDDEEQEVRELVLNSLEASENIEPLRAALKSERLDVQLAAAYSLAKRGDSSCREVLVTVIQTPEPEEECHFEKWQIVMESALKSLGQLGDPSTLDSIAELIENNKHAWLRKAAAKSLIWVVRPDTTDRIEKYLAHEDEAVKSRVALAMSVGVDARSLPLVFAAETSLTDRDRLVAAAVLDSDSETELGAIIDSPNEDDRNAALIVVLVRDWLQHDGSPRRLTGCLAAKCSRVRLLAASAVKNFADSNDVFEVINDLFNDRGDQTPWTIPEDVIRRVAAVVGFGSEHLLARLVSILNDLGQDKQTKWDRSWKVFSQRYADEIAEAEAKKAKPPKLTVDQDALNQLTFGVYVGLIRQQSCVQISGFGMTAISVRESAIRKLVALAQAEPKFNQSAVSVLTQTTGDRYTEIRKFAFEQLAELGVSDDRRAAIAIGARHRDLAVTGLELLQSSATKAEQKKLLQKIILGRNDEIAFEAARLLKQQMDEVKVCELCFDSPYMKLPAIATSWLAALYDSSPAAKKLLQSLAMDSEDFDVRRTAVATLVNNNDEMAYDCLADAASSDDAQTRQSYLRLFAKLKDERGVGFLVSEIESHEEYDDQIYLNAIGMNRDPSVGERLIDLFENRPSARARIFPVLQKISGYDQPIRDPNELLVDQSFRDSEFPRHDELLAKIISSVNQFGTAKQLKALIPGARWAKGNEVDPVLKTLAVHPDEPVRRDAVEAIGFRARKRDADVSPLLEALEHRDPIMKFLAAEGLAKAGNNQGIHVLLTAIELVDDLRLRRRAVLALGHLADERAFDVLLKLATEDAHALQDCAAEAIGHLRESPGKEKILRTLIRLAGSGGSVARQALVGLRWLDDVEGWDLIRDRASHENELRWTAIEQLGYNHDPASQAILIELLELNYGSSIQLLEFAKRSFGPDSVAPELAWAKSQPEMGDWTIRLQMNDAYAITANRTLDRIREMATPEQIFDLVGGCCAGFRKQFTRHLLMCSPLPVEQAAGRLDDENPAIAETSASIIGRSGDKKQAKALKAAIEKWLGRASEKSRKLFFADVNHDDEFRKIVSCLKRLIWATGVSGGNENLLAEIINDHGELEGFAPIRHAAIDELRRVEKITDAVAKQLKTSLDDTDPYVRTGTTQILAAAPKAKLNDLAELVLPDRGAFNRLGQLKAGEIKKTIQASASHTHYQARSLPFLIKAGDTKTLSSVATDEKLSLVARLGAVEGLAKIPGKESEKHLAAIAKKESNDEELRKAAWRGLRRAKRSSKQKAETK